MCGKGDEMGQAQVVRTNIYRKEDGARRVRRPEERQTQRTLSQEIKEQYIDIVTIYHSSLTQLHALWMLVILIGLGLTLAHLPPPRIQPASAIICANCGCGGKLRIDPTRREIRSENGAK